MKERSPVNNFIKIAFTVVEIRNFFAAKFFRMKKEDKYFFTSWLNFSQKIRNASKVDAAGIKKIDLETKALLGSFAHILPLPPIILNKSIVPLLAGAGTASKAR